MTIIAIDPGPIQSAYVVTNGRVVFEHGKVENEFVLALIADAGGRWPTLGAAVCERIRCMGMAVGATTLETAEWCGRFQQQWLRYDETPLDRWHWVTRNEEKLHLCGSPRAKDANIRQALLDRFGGKDKAIGTKKAKGPLWGIAGDCWSALAVALTFLDLRRVTHDKM